MGTVLRRVFAGSHEISVALGGRAAVTLLDAGYEFDVVLCDIMMPDLGGPEVYEIARRRRPELVERFVFITGGAVHEQNQAFLASVANRVLHKPFNLAAVRDVVQLMTARAA